MWQPELVRIVDDRETARHSRDGGSEKVIKTPYIVTGGGRSIDGPVYAVESSLPVQDAACLGGRRLFLIQLMSVQDPILCH
jgi:hypothetical protein